MKTGSIVTCQFGMFGDSGYRKSSPVKIIDITSGDRGVKEYWVRILGLSVIGLARAPAASERNVKTELICSSGKFIGTNGQYPRVKGIDRESDALVYLGYGIEVPSPVAVAAAKAIKELERA